VSFTFRDELFDRTGSDLDIQDPSSVGVCVFDKPRHGTVWARACSCSFVLVDSVVQS
jgi:hypothetical protein